MATVCPLTGCRLKLPRPEDSDKWLVVVHVEMPRHWTLVELRWSERSIHFYDSFSAIGGYASVVEQQIRGLLSICEGFFKQDLSVAEWRWVGEQVRARVR